MGLSRELKAKSGEVDLIAYERNKSDMMVSNNHQLPGSGQVLNLSRSPLKAAINHPSVLIDPR
jgi:hypothetical protein